jgi:hypothetical protein
VKRAGTVRRQFSKDKSGDNSTREVVAAVLLISLQATRVRLAAVCAVTFGTAARLFEGRGRVMWKALKTFAVFRSTAKKYPVRSC